MEKVYVGKIVSTHGIKGEIKIISDFQFKDKVFVNGNSLLIDDKSYIIKSYRVHKNYDMVTLNDFNDINQVMFLMKKKVYFDKSLLELNNEEVLDSDLLKYKVVDNLGRSGKVLEIFFASPTNKIIRVLLDKEYLIPYKSPLVKKFDKENKTLYIEVVEGM